jgi:hypothetical protein
MDVEVQDLGEEIDEQQGDPGRPTVDNFRRNYRNFDWNSSQCAEGLAVCRDEAAVSLRLFCFPTAPLAAELRF